MSVVIQDQFRTEDRTFFEWYTLRNRALLDTFARRFPSAYNKCSLSFILNHTDVEEKSTYSPRILKTENFKPILPPSSFLSTTESNTESKYGRKRHARRCSVVGCNRYKISRGHCFRHGVRTPNLCWDMLYLHLLYREGHLVRSWAVHPAQKSVGGVGDMVGKLLSLISTFSSNLRGL